MSRHQNYLLLFMNQDEVGARGSILVEFLPCTQPQINLRAVAASRA
jgi:hypothetical protein